MRKLLIVIISIYLIIGCEENIPLSDLDLSVKSKLILNGGISEGQLYFGIARSQSVEDKDDLYSYPSAEVSLIKDGIPLKSKDINVTPIYSYVYNETGGWDSAIISYEYSVIDSGITAGDSYLLKAKVPDFDTLYAPCYIPAMTTFEIVSFDFMYQTLTANRYTVILKINDDPQQDNFYQIEVSGNAGKYSFNPVQLWYPGARYDEQNIYVFKDKNLSKNEITIELIEPFENGRIDQAYIELYQIDSASYYYDLTKQAQEDMYNTNNFYAFEPINIYSNVINGHGYIESRSPIFKDSVNLIEVYPGN